MNKMNSDEERAMLPVSGWDPGGEASFCCLEYKEQSLKSLVEDVELHSQASPRGIVCIK